MNAKHNQESWYDNITFSHDLAHLSDGYVTLKCGNTIILSTVNVGKEKHEKGFISLSVKYTERFYASGRIPGNYNRREGRPTTDEILISRLIDRAIRPSIVKNFPYDISLSCHLLSYDDTIGNVETLSIMAASAAIRHSSVITSTTVAAVKIGLQREEDGKVTVAANLLPASDPHLLHMMISGNKNSIFMTDGKADIVPLATIKKCMSASLRFLQIGQRVIEDQITDGTTPQVNSLSSQDLRELERHTQSYINQHPIVFSSSAIKELLLTLPNHLQQVISLSLADISRYTDSYIYKQVIHHIETTGRRLDGRSADQIRDIKISASYLPSAHGSCLLTRGNTSTLSTVTLGSKDKGQHIDGAIIEPYIDSRLVHYNFESHCTGEVSGLSSGPKRREIGHGQIIKNSLAPVLPVDEYPYAIRICCDTMSADGSTSLSAVCASSVALMDVGIPVATHVGAVGIGMLEGKKGTIMLSDITQIEDAMGILDAKIAGTTDGITMLMFDIKSPSGVPLDSMLDVLDRGHANIIKVIERLTAEIKEYRSSYRHNVPVVHKLTIDPNQIKRLIGKQGVTIKRLTKEFGANINVNDDGVVTIYCSQNILSNILNAINTITNPYSALTVGQAYQGNIVKVLGRGVIVSLTDSLDGYLPTSELQKHKINPAVNLSVDVVVSSVNNEKVRLSLK